MRRIWLLVTALLSLSVGIQAQEQSEGEALKDRLYTEIMQAYNVQDWPQLTELVERVIAAGGQLEELEISYCEALGHTDRAPLAVDRMQKYLQVNPGDYQAWQLQGDLQQQIGNTDQAVEAYSKSAQLKPGFARPLVSLARLYGSDDPAKAMDNYNQAIEIFLSANRPDAAISLGSEAMQIDDANVETLLLMGRALVEANMADKALPFYAEAINQATSAPEPDMAALVEANYNIALIYYRAGDYKRSMAFLEGMFGSNLLPNAPKQAHVQALCLAAADSTRLGKEKEAQKYADQAQVVDPDGWRAIYDDLLAISESSGK